MSEEVSEFAKIIRECWQIAEDHGFHSIEGVTFGDRCALIHSEVTEAFEAWRRDGKHWHYIEVDGKPEGTASELADVVIRVFDSAIADVGMTATQFEALIVQKMEYNRRRPFRHGKAI